MTVLQISKYNIYSAQSWQPVTKSEALVWAARESCRPPGSSEF